MSKKIFLCLSLICSISLFSQAETCESPTEDVLLDMNSITKCSIEKKDGDKTANKSVAVVVSSRRRVVRKRDVASGLNSSINSHKVSGVNEKNTITSNLNLSKSKNTSMIVPFRFVEEVPLFKKCLNAPILQQKSCFKSELSSHIKKNFKYPEEAYSQAIQGRVLVYFNIKNDGTLGQMKVTSPYKGELLGKEAERIIKKLPAFKPAKHDGNNVSVNYSIPISFKIPGVKPSNVRSKIIKENLNELFTFNQVETIPLFKVCSETNDSSMSCYNKNFVKHIEDNFAYPEEAVTKNIEGIINVKFVVNKQGNVINIETEGSENGEILKLAARNLVNKLPKFKPATKNGRPVNTSYSFPVNFKLD